MLLLRLSERACVNACVCEYVNVLLLLLLLLLV